MATKIHRMLVDLIARKMREKGYTVVAVEGSLLSVPDNDKSPIPWTIKRHRPDLIGVKTDSRRVCIGEAKTSADLLSKRTADQFSDFASIIGKNGEKVELIIGVPLLAKQKLLQILENLNVPSSELSIILLPEELAENEDESLF